MRSLVEYTVGTVGKRSGREVHKSYGLGYKQSRRSQELSFRLQAVKTFTRAFVQATSNQDVHKSFRLGYKESEKWCYSLLDQWLGEELNASGRSVLSVFRRVSRHWSSRRYSPKDAYRKGKTKRKKEKD